MLTERDVIEFYRVNERYGSFSNFAPYPVDIDGKTWPTSEHYFQAQKFLGEDYKEKIRRAESPAEAARLGRSRAHPIRADWEAVKDGIMARAVRAKFDQHPDIARVLLSTGAARLVEHTVNDSYWADGGDGSGKNRLGQILMQVREELKVKSK